ncbi:hypothetical protein NN561_000777 [Cricetulus griseus]
MPAQLRDLRPSVHTGGPGKVLECGNFRRLTFAKSTRRPRLRPPSGPAPGQRLMPDGQHLTEKPSRFLPCDLNLAGFSPLRPTSPAAVLRSQGLKPAETKH